jgi:LacI family transcriptional regulator
MRVRDAVEQLGYQPNAVAQSMRTRATHAVAFVIPDICNPIFSTIVRAADQILLEAGYSLMLANTDLNPVREAEIISVFVQRRIDALIMAVSNENNPDLVRAIKGLEMPIVMLNRELSVPCDSVLIDDFNGLRHATQYLIQLGHKRIGLITADENIAPGRQRIAGFKRALADGKLEVDESLIRRGRFEIDGYREAFAVLNRDNPPTAIIAGTQVLVGVLRALKQLEWRMPDDVSLIGTDDTYFGEFANPPLTVIERSLTECGRMAAGLVLRRLRGDAPEQQQRIVLPTRLVRRDSCGPPRTERSVQKA